MVSGKPTTCDTAPMIAPAPAVRPTHHHSPAPKSTSSDDVGYQSHCSGSQSVNLTNPMVVTPSAHPHTMATPNSRQYLACADKRQGMQVSEVAPCVRRSERMFATCSGMLDSSHDCPRLRANKAHCEAGPGDDSWPKKHWLNDQDIIQGICPHRHCMPTVPKVMPAHRLATAGHAGPWIKSSVNATGR